MTDGLGHARPRRTRSTCCARCCCIRRFEEKARRALQRWARSAASCTSTSARRRSRSGAMQALTPDDAIVATYREHGHALARGIPAGALMAEMYGKANGCSRGRGGSMHLFDAARRFYGGNAIVGGGLPLAVGLALADKLQARAARDRLLLRRRRGGRGRVPRVAEPRRALAAARCSSSARTTSTRWAPRSPATSRRPTSARKAERLRHAGRGRGRHGRARGRGGRRAAPPTRVRRGRRPVPPGAPHLPLPRPLDVRPRAVPERRRRSSSGSSATPSRSSPRGCASGASSTTPIWRRSRPRSPREIDAAVAFAEAGPWEPVEDLTRDVYTPVTP